MKQPINKSCYRLSKVLPVSDDVRSTVQQDIEYVVVDDEKTSRERVALAHEEIESYDPSYYETQLIRAVESVLSPLGWDRAEIRRELTETRVPKVTAYANIENS